MKCLNPIDAWACGYASSSDGVVSPRFVFSFNKASEYFSRIHGDGQLAFHYLEKAHVHLPCGKCVNCLMRKRKDMSTRIRHELSRFRDCCFLTLTYNDENLPRVTSGAFSDKNPVVDRGDLWGNPTLVPSDVQKFMKRLRRHLEYSPLRVSKIRRDHVASPIRYFAVGEYGSNTRRPHYHIIIFGWRPSDLVVHHLKNSYCVYRSAQVEKLWPFGFSTVGECNAGVAKYCAQYVTKKFSRLDSLDYDVCPEFVLQSVRNGGIGSSWFDAFGESNIVHGYVNCLNSHGVPVKCPVPRYYYDRLRKVNLPLWLDLREARIEFVRNRQIQLDPDLIVASARFAEVQIKNEKRKEVL